MMAIIDVKSRFILNWSISNTMDASWCTDVLKETIALHGKPEILNTDQESQFTSAEFQKVLQDNAIQISMNGKGRALVGRSNQFVKYFLKHSGKTPIEFRISYANY